MSTTAEAAVRKDAEEEVTYEDQQRINKFGGLTTKLHQLEAAHDDKRKDIARIQNAIAELLMLEQEKVMYHMGEAFVEVDTTTAQEMLEKEEARFTVDAEQIAQETAKIKATLTELKASLYAKFGRAAINLEED
eukprot:TRINITY_DN18510_c0_g1_i1.p2 TRINITY_DN18510_c0_g1~~TRINITY_DN18510_c0_g1_i1.p2  ORF type:complete len:134 (-),score=67.70 TRINITY_DN18510_c0_g1_i1:72-473(-)